MARATRTLLNATALHSRLHISLCHFLRCCCNCTSISTIPSDTIWGKTMPLTPRVFILLLLFCVFFLFFCCCIVRDINSPCINAELLLRVIGGKIHTAGALCCDMRQCTAGRHANMGSERDGEEKINRVRLNYAAKKTIFIYFRVFFFLLLER